VGVTSVITLVSRDLAKRVYSFCLSLVGTYSIHVYTFITQVMTHEIVNALSLIITSFLFFNILLISLKGRSRLLLRKHLSSSTHKRPSIDISITKKKFFFLEPP
jgi:hypothetical protein